MQQNYDKHDVRNCSLCESSFPCLANRAHECPCQLVRLTQDETEWVACKAGGDCVCTQCLIALREEFKSVTP